MRTCGRRDALAARVRALRVAQANFVIFTLATIRDVTHSRASRRPLPSSPPVGKLSEMTEIDIVSAHKIHGAVDESQGRGTQTYAYVYGSIRTEVLSYESTKVLPYFRTKVPSYLYFHTEVL